MINIKQETIDKITNYLETNDEIISCIQYDDKQTRELLDNSTKIINLNCLRKTISNLNVYKSGISILDVNCEYDINKYPFNKENIQVVKREGKRLLALRTTGYEKILKPRISESYIFIPKGFTGKFFYNISALYDGNLNLVLLKKEIINDKNLILSEDFQRGDVILTPSMSLISSDTTLSIEYSSVTQEPFYSRAIEEDGTHKKINSNFTDLIKDELGANVDKVGTMISNGMEKHLSLK